MDDDATPQHNAESPANSPSNSQGTTGPRNPQRSLFTTTEQLSQHATTEELITTVNANRTDISSLNADLHALSERFRATFKFTAENTEKLNALPLQYTTSEAFADHLTDLDEKLQILPGFVQKCDDAIARVHRASLPPANTDSYDELAGAQLSHEVDSNSNVEMTDEITTSEYMSGRRPMPTTMAVLNAKTRTDIFKSYLSTNYILNLARALKIEYYNLTDIPQDQQPKELHLNVLCRGGEVVFNKLLTAISTCLKTVRVGHSEKLLNLRQRMLTVDVASAYDECLNAILAALLMRVTIGTTKSTINSLTPEYIAYRGGPARGRSSPLRAARGPMD